MQDSQLTHFRQQYQKWLAATKSLLEAGAFKRAFATYPFLRYVEAPWAPLRRPLCESTLALVSTAGLYLKETQTPFDAANIEGDTSYRVFPHTVQPGQLGIAHEHYPHHYAEQDLNTVLPLEHLHALVREGIIGRFAPHVYSISGYLTDAATFAEGSARHIAAQMHTDGVEAALIIPV